jgi:hypothetical protein
MIQSAESPARKWKPAPAEFQVMWINTDPNPYRRRATPPEQKNAVHSSLILDFLQVTSAALYWNISDYLCPLSSISK